MRAAAVKPVRCAIYTRVSTEHGLDQEFNSLDAQYCPAAAQRSLNYRGAKRGTPAARAAGLELLIPILYLKGASTRDSPDPLLPFLLTTPALLPPATSRRLHYPSSH